MTLLNGQVDGKPCGLDLLGAINSKMLLAVRSESNTFFCNQRPESTVKCEHEIVSVPPGRKKFQCALMYRLRDAGAPLAPGNNTVSLENGDGSPGDAEDVSCCSMIDLICAPQVIVRRLPLRLSCR